MELLERNAPCWCGSGKKYKKCHEAFDEKLKMYENKGVLIPPMILLKLLLRSRRSKKALRSI